MTQHLEGNKKPGNLPSYRPRPAMPQVPVFGELWCWGCGTHTNELHRIRVWRGLRPESIDRCTNCTERKHKR